MSEHNELIRQIFLRLIDVGRILLTAFFHFSKVTVHQRQPVAALLVWVEYRDPFGVLLCLDGISHAPIQLGQPFVRRIQIAAVGAVVKDHVCLTDALIFPSLPLSYQLLCFLR